MKITRSSFFVLALTLALGIGIGAAMTGFVNAMQHVKVTELYKADLVTSEGNEGSMFLAELGPGANMGKHYHPGDAFAYILEGTMLLEIAGKDSVTLKAGQGGSLPPRARRQERQPDRPAEVPGVPRCQEGRTLGSSGAVSDRRLSETARSSPCRSAARRRAS